MEARRTSCAACGPCSLRGQERDPPHECSSCDAADGKFDLAAVDLYTRCSHCKRKVTVVCLTNLRKSALEALASKIGTDRAAWAERIEDGDGFWAAFLDNVFLDPVAARRHPHVFKPQTHKRPGEWRRCIFCEGGTIRPCGPRTSDEFKELLADFDIYQFVVPFRRMLPDGKYIFCVRLVEAVHAFPTMMNEYSCRQSITLGCEGAGWGGLPVDFGPGPSRQQARPSPIACHEMCAAHTQNSSTFSPPRPRIR